MASSQPHRFPVPPGSIATVRIIDTTSRISMLPTEVLLKPGIKGLQYLPTLPAWSFLIENQSSNRKILFDLGIPTDWQNLAPEVSNRLKTNGWKIEVSKGVKQLLEEAGVNASEIESMIWSHWHWDHIGNPETFPSSTELVVGPGFKKGLLPAYPEKEDSSVRESDFKNRTLREITFEEPGVLQIGQFRAFDFFGDGSFYLLDTPGHAIGHLAGLARTSTSPDTFIFMGGDLTHHGSEIRPSPYLSLPKEIPAFILGRTCPGAAFEAVLESKSLSKQEPFTKPAIGHSKEEAVRTIKKAQEADADDNVLYLFAHDPTVWGVVDFFPSSANDWKKKGWRDRVLWAFLEDLKGELDESDPKISSSI